MRLTLLRFVICLTLSVFICSSTAHAQLPFYTDDSDTTPKGHFHIEVSNEQDILQRVAYPTRRQNTVVFTFNYGITHNLEFGVNAPLITFSNARIVKQRNPTDIGDTQFGLKYNFLAEREGSKLPALAVVFYVEAPTGDSRRQFGSGLTDYWVYGVMQKSFTKKTKGRLNGGILFSGNDSTGLIGLQTTRGQIYTGNASLVRDFTDKLTLGFEVFGAVTGNFLLDRGQITGQVGGHYGPTKKLTLTFGVLGGHFASSPRVGALVGFAYDF